MAAITSYGSAVNRVYRSDARKSFFEDAKALASSAVSWNQGDLLYLDTSAHLIKRVAATGDAATFLGIAENTVSAGILVGPYSGLTAVNAAEAIACLVGPSFGVEALMVLKTSDAFNPGDKVYLVSGGNSQQVSVTDPGDGNYIGQFQGPAVASAAAGQTGACLLFGRGITGAVHF